MLTLYHILHEALDRVTSTCCITHSVVLVVDAEWLVGAETESQVGPHHLRAALNAVVASLQVAPLSKTPISVSLVSLSPGNQFDSGYISFELQLVADIFQFWFV